MQKTTGQLTWGVFLCCTCRSRAGSRLVVLASNHSGQQGRRSMTVRSSYCAQSSYAVISPGCHRPPASSWSLETSKLAVQVSSGIVRSCRLANSFQIIAQIQLGNGDPGGRGGGRRQETSAISAHSARLVRTGCVIAWRSLPLPPRGIPK